MSAVAILTDFGEKDNFVGVMKGVILKINPQVKIVDITHQVKRHNIKEAGFLLLHSFSFFPKNTVFLVVVDPGVGSKRKPLAVKTTNYYFVGPDNGVLSLALKKDGIKKSIELNNKEYFLKGISSTFHGRDIFAPVAAHLSKGIKIEKMGRKIKKINEITFPYSEIKRDRIIGEILYIDRFGNLITNIKKSLLRKGFSGTFKQKKIFSLYHSYQEAKEKEPFFIEGSFSFLEISIKEDSAQSYFKAKEGDKIVVRLPQ